MRAGLGLIAALIGAGVLLTAVMPARAQNVTTGGMSLRYSDAQGPGCLTIQTLGASDNDGGTAISVTLTQNGVSLSGQGEQWSLTQVYAPGPQPASPALPIAQPPRGSALAFWLGDDTGDTFFFDGTFSYGVDTLNAQGSWTYIQNPAVTGQWQASQLFGGRGCTGS